MLMVLMRGGGSCRCQDRQGFDLCWCQESICADAYEGERGPIYAEAWSCPFMPSGRMAFMLRRGYQAVNYANARQISDFYWVSDILEISTPKALQFIYVFNIKLNRKEEIFGGNQRVLYQIVDSSLFLEISIKFEILAMGEVWGLEEGEGIKN